MAGYDVEAEAEALRGAYLRIATCGEGVIEESALLRSLSDRLLAELIMCDPTYVLGVEERARALIPPIRTAKRLSVAGSRPQRKSPQSKPESDK